MNNWAHFKTFLTVKLISWAVVSVILSFTMSKTAHDIAIRYTNAIVKSYYVELLFIPFGVMFLLLIAVSIIYAL